ncbi:toxin-antitoxin system HicB family antitoxin [uncultured Nocardioides sp.]|jgi:hypothetical protein|uniref:toxin-antitoxin system HicB family antitoxin n=1 Tax=uncultured Nocardioides sp. TaxID=198441 RepID=UPI002626B991|nr:toxin-antitoxin system HicB family antitoxin [uncultured Nocardioides sp.]
MDIAPYVDSLRRDLLAAAEAGGPEVAAAAERLGYALEPATRLALMEALSQAAAEITAAMPTGGVDVRLDGRDLDFVVDAAPPVPPAPPAPPAPPRAEEPEEDASVARITLRLPESLKTKAEDAAAAAGSSLNTWLVQAVRSATHEGAVHVDIDLSSMPFFGSDPGRRGNRRMTGWV